MPSIAGCRADCAGSTAAGRGRDAIYPGDTLERIALRQYGDARK
ncbi:hypothetical protein [Methylosinus sporium]|nr:hypothetical protein [Methylosinus sporium]